MINRATAKLSALSSSKIDKYENLAGEKILPPPPKKQCKVIEDAKLIYLPLKNSQRKRNFLMGLEPFLRWVFDGFRTRNYYLHIMFQYQQNIMAKHQHQNLQSWNFHRNKNNM